MHILLERKFGEKLPETFYQVINMSENCLLPIPLIVLIISLIIPLGVSASSISFSPLSVVINESETADVIISIDNLPNGLAGYIFTVEIGGGEIAEITQISFPEWASLNNATDVPSTAVRINAVDMSLGVKPGSNNVILATITAKGKSSGSTTIYLKDIQIDADGGNLLDPILNPGTITVRSLSSSGGEKYDGSGESSASMITTMPVLTVTSSGNTIPHTNSDIDIGNIVDSSNVPPVNLEPYERTSGLTLSETPTIPENIPIIQSKSLPLSIWTIILVIVIGLGIMMHYRSASGKI